MSIYGIVCLIHNLNDLLIIKIVDDRNNNVFSVTFISTSFRQVIIPHHMSSYTNKTNMCRWCDSSTPLTYLRWEYAECDINGLVLRITPPLDHLLSSLHRHRVYISMGVLCINTHTNTNTNQHPAALQ